MKAIYEREYLQIGLKIAYFRKLRGLTQEQLAERIDRTPAFIGHVEAPNISKAVSLDTLFDIASVLDIPAYKFLMFDD
ncbi:MAG: helix-turn-helix transcriptional regulator [Lawsonibacter sp.]|nr:helix-turn-helix transcriptional regulator [Lawsonibacter sp.]